MADDIPPMSNCEDIAPDSDGITSLVQRIDALAQKLAEERTERLKMSKLLAELALAFGKQATRSKAAMKGLPCVQGSDLTDGKDNDVVLEPLQDGKNQNAECESTEMDLDDLPNVLTQVHSAICAEGAHERVVKSRIAEGLADRCETSADGQVSKGQQSDFKAAERSNEGMCQLNQDMSAIGQELAQAVQDIGEKTKKQILQVTEGMASLGQELMNRLEHLEGEIATQNVAQANMTAEHAAQNQHLTTLRALRELDVKRADEHDQLLIRQHELIRRQGERFSSSIDALLKANHNGHPLSSAVVAIHSSALQRAVSPGAQRPASSCVPRASQQGLQSSGSQGEGLSVSTPGAPASTAQSSTGGKAPTPAVSRTSSLTSKVDPSVQVLTLQDSKQASPGSSKQEEAASANLSQVVSGPKGGMKAPIPFLGPTTPPAKTASTRELLRAKSWSPSGATRYHVAKSAAVSTAVTYRECTPGSVTFRAVPSRSATPTPVPSARTGTPRPVALTTGPTAPSAGMMAPSADPLGRSMTLVQGGVQYQLHQQNARPPPVSRHKLQI